MTMCRDVMTQNPVSAMPEDTVASVARLMKENDIGPIPIVENQKSKKLVGIVTDRDLALKVIAEGRDPQTTPVKQVMSISVITCHDDDDIESALNAMSAQQIRRIPVVDNNNMLLGIIAQADIATRMDEPAKTAAVVKDISE